MKKVQGLDKGKRKWNKLEHILYIVNVLARSGATCESWTVPIFGSARVQKHSITIARAIL